MTTPRSGKPTYQAFISHAHQDQEFARELVATLEARDLRCWIAGRDMAPGAEWGEGIMEGIRASRCLVLVLSESANASGMVRREVERAVSLGLPVIPIRIEEGVLPSRSLEFFVSAAHWVDAWQQPVAECAVRLAEALRDERRLGELEDVVRQGLKRRRMPRILAGVGLFVALVAAIVIGNQLTGGAAENPYHGALGKAADEHDVDLDALTADDFAVSLDFEFPSSVDGWLVVETDDAGLGHLVEQGWLEYRLDQGPWQTFMPTRTDPPAAGLPFEAVDAPGPVELRLDSAFGSIVSDEIWGPFRYDLSPEDELLEASKAAAAADTSWLTPKRSWWNSDLKFFFRFGPVLTSIAVGASPDRWLMEEVFEDVPRDHAYAADRVSRLSAMGRAFDAQLRELGPVPELHLELRFVDGTSARVVARPTEPVEGRAWVPPVGSGGELQALPLELDPYGRLDFRFLHERYDAIETMAVGPSADALHWPVEVLGEEGRTLARGWKGPFLATRHRHAVEIPATWTEAHVRITWNDGAPPTHLSGPAPVPEHPTIELAGLAEDGSDTRVPPLLAHVTGNRRASTVFAHPLVPPRTTRVLASVDGSSYTELNRPEFRGTDLQPTLPGRVWLVFQDADGGETGPFVYALDPLAELIRGAFVGDARTHRRELLVARRTTRVAGQVGVLRLAQNLGHLEADEVRVVVAPQSGPGDHSWFSIEEAELFDVDSGERLAAIQVDPEPVRALTSVDPLWQQPTEEDRYGFVLPPSMYAVLPAEVEAVSVVYRLADGSSTDPVRLAVEQG